MPEESFTRTLCLERKRSERSRKPFLLMLIDADTLFRTADKDEILKKLLSALHSSTRETDVRGWYKNDSVLGTIFTEISAGERNSVRDVRSEEHTSELQSRLHLVCRLLLEKKKHESP